MALLRSPYCECGCGKITAVAPWSNIERGWVKGEHIRFVKGHQNRKRPHLKEGFSYCTRCQKVKSADSFHVYKSGESEGQYRQYCIDCSRETWRERYSDPIKKAAASKRAKENERSKSREEKRQYKKLKRERNLEKERARDSVRYRVSTGYFPPAWTMVCEICQETQAKHWHHHKGYSEEYRLDVIAVCTICHGKEHWL